MFEALSQSTTAFSLLAAIVGLLVLLILSYGLRSQDGRREPPGPKPLPLLGNLLQVDLKRLDSSLFQLSKTYGPVSTVYFGPKKVVVLAGHRTVKQALVNHAEEFGDREVTPIFYDLNQGHGEKHFRLFFFCNLHLFLVKKLQPLLFPGILFTNGDTWKEMRRFAVTMLREFGMGKRLSEGRIIEECHYLIEVFEQYEGKAFNNSQAISNAASNIISAIVFGKRFEYEDPVFQAMVKRAHETIHLTGSASILGSKIKDSLYHNDNLLHSVMNLFAAGTDTTGSTLQWCLLLMAKYPHFQDQVQEELSRVAGSRQIRVEDRKNMPFTDAVIHESQRLANIVPLAIPHKTSRDVTFQGYFIKGGTTVFPLLTSVLYDESEWESPHTFNPSHFLDEDGKFIRRDAFMPFSAGRRVCLGEGLARMELFIFFTSLLQRFRFTPPPGVTEDDLDLTPVVGNNLNPPPHELCAVRRH
ncbi:cytochrome P450 2K1-like isoform 4-T4 [Acanthopagrus schlegelii]